MNKIYRMQQMMDIHNNKILRDNAWRDISKHFESKYNRSEINAKWSNLYIQFRGYVARIKKISGQV